MFFHIFKTSLTLPIHQTNPFQSDPPPPWSKNPNVCRHMSAWSIHPLHQFVQCHSSDLSNVQNSRMADPGLVFYWHKKLAWDFLDFETSFFCWPARFGRIFKKRMTFKYTPEVWHSPWKIVVGRLLSFWDGTFSGAMLNFGRVKFEKKKSWTSQFNFSDHGHRAERLPSSRTAIFKKSVCNTWSVPGQWVVSLGEYRVHSDGNGKWTIWRCI